MSEVMYPDVHVELTGGDGNASAIIAAVSKALRRNVGSDTAAWFRTRATQCQSYDELLRFAMSTVDVS